MKAKYIFLVAVVATLLVSCTSIVEINEIVSNQETVENLNTTSFTASMETAVGTKTALAETGGGYALNWEFKDQIKIYSGTTSAIFETRDMMVTQASFYAVDNANLPASDKYEAYYPATLDKNNLSLPSKQTYARDNISGYPMYAESSTRSLSFCNLCGVLRFRVNLKESGKFDVASITLSSKGKGLSGAFHISGKTAVMDKTNSEITLECPSAVTLYSASVTDFYIYVPAGDYNPLKVKIVSSEGVERNFESDGVIPVIRSEMTSVNITFSASTGSDGSTEFITANNVNVNFSER